MQFDGLGRAITAPFSAHGAIATLHERGLVLSGAAGTLTARFGFAHDNGPAVATTGAVRAVIGDPIRFQIGGWRPSTLESGLHWALSGRLGLRESRAGVSIVPMVPGAVELASAVYGRAAVAPLNGHRFTPSAIRLIGLGDPIGG